MASALVVVLLFAVGSAVLSPQYNRVAATTHSLRVWLLPSQHGAAIASLKARLVESKKTLANTSAQDHFAQWAKERRRHDKLAAEYEAVTKAQASQKASFERTVSWGLWAAMWAINLFLVFWYRRTPMFYVPWEFVGPFSWVLSFPFAPRGSVSFAFWLFACKNVIAKILSLAPALTAPVPVDASGTGKRKAE
ncbi:CHD5-like protein-domain-containing protein [Chytriomyces sp. MP71]|nr:CHD5-like protein-domain-containing protein [Chytriomyces sp. MP71]